MMQQAFQNRSLQDPALALLIADRFHWMRLPPTVTGRPYINAQVIDDPPVYHSEGPSDWHDTQLQIDIWAETYQSAMDVRAAFLPLWSGRRLTFGGVQFQGVYVTGDRDLPGSTITTAPLFRRSVDLKITWKLEY